MAQSEKTFLQEVKEELAHLLQLDNNMEFSLEEPPANIKADLATNVLLILAKKNKIKPESLSDNVIAKLKKSRFISDPRFLHPGFLNFSIRKEFLHSELDRISIEQDRYPRINLSEQKILIDFVSSNPTGPLHIGHGRGAVIGDTLSNIFSHFGYKITKEYYINDVGTQTDILAQSVILRSREILENKPHSQAPDLNIYKGDYIIDVAKKLLEKFNNKIPGPEQVKEFSINEILNNIKSDLADFRVRFDSWIYESDLHKKNIVKKVIELLSKNKFIYEEDSAVWFKSKELGDEKDRVIQKKDGNYTYFGADIAYHWHKFDRGYQRLVDIWGADHHGYMARIKASIKAMGFDSRSLDILLYQLVSLSRGGEKVRISTRSGEFITLREVIDEIGVDATRYFLSTKSPGAHLEFDLEIAKKRAPENPIYYIQYAHTRCCGILRELQKKKDIAETETKKVDLNMLKEPEEYALIKKVIFFQEALYRCISDLSPHHLAGYLLDTAGVFHRFYDTHRVITENTQLTQARLFLVRIIKTVIKNGLDKLGISAPEVM